LAAAYTTTAIYRLVQIHSRPPAARLEVVAAPARHVSSGEKQNDSATKTVAPATPYWPILVTAEQPFAP